MKLVIAGLLPIQQSELRQEYGKHADLRFMDNQQDAGSWKRTLQTAVYDRAVLNTRFMSHAQLQAFPREKRIIVNGGLSAMRHELDKLLPEARSAPKTAMAMAFVAAAAPPVEEPVNEPEPTPSEIKDASLPVNARVHNYILSTYASHPTYTTEDLVQKLGGTSTAVNQALFQAHHAGYLDRPKKGFYSPNARTPELANTGTTRKAPTPRRVEQPADKRSPIEHLEEIALSLIGAIEELKKQKLDLSQVGQVELIQELARRNK